MRVVVTGASGFIGRRLVQRLADLNCEIITIDRGPKMSSIGRHVTADISHSGNWSDAFEGADVVFHLAGKAHALSEVRQDDAEYARINATGTRLVLTASKAGCVRRFVFFSSVKAMSRDDDVSNFTTRPTAPLDESISVTPDSPYGQSKLAAEILVLDGGFVPEPVVLRLCMVYGPGAKGNLAKMLDAIDRRRFPPLPDVHNRRSMVHVDDVVSAAVLASNHPRSIGELFIVSDGIAYSTGEIVAAMYAQLGRTIPSWKVPLIALKAAAQIGDVVAYATGRRAVLDSVSLVKLLGSAWFSPQKLIRELGFAAEWTLERALPSMVAELRSPGGGGR